MPTFFRRSVSSGRRIRLAAVALELAGAAAAVAVAVAAVASAPLVAGRPPRRPATRRPAPTLMYVPTQRCAPLDS